MPFDIVNFMSERKRSKWTQSKNLKLSIPFGKVVPLGAPVEVLPHDTWKLNIGSIIRMLTPKAPLMDEISGDIYAYYVPNRIVFDRSKQFFGQNEDVAFTLNLEHTIPHIQFNIDVDDYYRVGTTDNYVLSSIDSQTFAPYGDKANFTSSLLDYFELPFVHIRKWQYDNIDAVTAEGNQCVFSINALPFRMYQMIWNYDFRNPSVVDPMLDFAYDHSDIEIQNLANDDDELPGFSLKPVMRYRDFLSTALKQPQRGPSVELFLGTSAPLMVGDYYSVGGIGVDTEIEFVRPGAAGDSPFRFRYNESDDVYSDSGDKLTGTNVLVDLSKATASTVNQFRNTIALQHLYEMMTSAFRYREYVEVFFGVKPRAEDLDEPQCLGGMHFDINVSQVLTTADSTNSVTGDTGAYSATSLRGHIYTSSFDEHGMIMLLIVLRKEHTYVQSLDALWRKREFLDFFQEPFQDIGNVPLRNSEVALDFKVDGSIDDDTFGYVEPDYEYRHMISKAVALMNPMAPGSLAYYALTDVFDSKPYLNAEFVSEDANGLDNALVASADVTDQFFGEFYFRYTSTRAMKVRSVPGLTRI